MRFLILLITFYLGCVTFLVADIPKNEFIKVRFLINNKNFTKYVKFSTVNTPNSFYIINMEE